MSDNIKTNELELFLDETVINRNLEMLNQDMINLLNTESIGGNAGTVDIGGKKYSCGGANGYANPETGEIIVFDNIQDIRNKKIIEENVDFTLRVAMDWQTGQFIKIVNFMVTTYNKNKLSDKAKLTIEAAINRWNIQHQYLIQPRQK